MVHVEQSLPAVCLEFLAIEKKDPDYALHENPPFVTADESNAVSVRMRKYVNARCKDLLEVHFVPTDAQGFTYHVDFLHRSVRDFLSARDMYTLLRNRSGEHFDARVSLCKIALAEIKTMCRIIQQLGVDRSSQSFLKASIYDFFSYVRMAERYNGSCEIPLIDELHEVLRTYKSGSLKAEYDVLAMLPAYRYKDNEPIVALAVETRLLPYVREKLSLHPQLISKKDDWTLLDHAITLPSIGCRAKFLTIEETIDVEMITLLLSHGVPPNQKDARTHRSTWDRFLRQCHEKRTSFYQNQKRSLVEIIKLFIQYGADTNVEVVSNIKPKMHSTKGRWGRPRTITLPIPMREIFEANFTPSQVAQINKVIEGKRKFSIWKWVGWE
jgi:hypothetical protein